MICANPDRVVHRGERLIYCGGALADLYGALGGEVVMAGKPHPAIYGLCLAQAQVLTHRAEPRVLCIGDGIATDVKGAERGGLDCLFISGGIHGAETQAPDGGMDAGKVGALLAQAQTQAALAMPALCW
jgi:ribonucleotide monophosphatase NagD (HAD superfamily)